MALAASAVVVAPSSAGELAIATTLPHAAAQADRLDGRLVRVKGAMRLTGGALLIDTGNAVLGFPLLVPDATLRQSLITQLTSEAGANPTSRWWIEATLRIKQSPTGPAFELLGFETLKAVRR